MDYKDKVLIALQLLKGEKYDLTTYIFPAPGTGNIGMLTGAFGQV